MTTYITYALYVTDDDGRSQGLPKVLATARKRLSDGESNIVRRKLCSIAGINEGSWGWTTLDEINITSMHKDIEKRKKRIRALERALATTVMAEDLLPS